MTGLVLLDGVLEQQQHDQHHRHELHDEHDDEQRLRGRPVGLFRLHGGTE